MRTTAEKCIELFVGQPAYDPPDPMLTVGPFLRAAMARAAERALIAPTCARDVCSALRRETRETIRALDESNAHGIERAIASPLAASSRRGRCLSWSAWREA